MMRKPIAEGCAARQSRSADSRRRAGSLLVAAFAVVLLLAAHASMASASGPWWRVGSEVLPSNLSPGTEGRLIVTIANLGDAPINGATTPVQVTDELPAGLVATAMSGQQRNGSEVKCPSGEPPVPPLTCTYTGVLYPYEELAITVRVKVNEPPGTVTSLSNEVHLEGGGAPAVSTAQRVPISDEPVSFGVHNLEVTPTNEDGSPATQAGSHPFQLTTSLVTNQTGERQPVALPKDLRFNLPPGLIGNPTAVAQCSEANFSTDAKFGANSGAEANLCQPSSVIGAATVIAYEPLSSIVTKTVPIFNLVPARGEPARFGFEVLGKIPIVIDTSVRTGKDYGVVATVKNATQVAGLLSSQVTLWGDPGDARHNSSRGWECIDGGFYANQVKKSCPATSAESENPFLTLPTSCAQDPATEPVVSSMEADSWAQPGTFLGAEYAWIGSEGAPLGFQGCSQLPFNPEIDVSPEEHAASTPTGLEVKVKVPQQSTLSADGLAEADVRDTTVTLPQGVELSPSAANGLEACSEAQIGYLGLNSQTQTDEFTDQAPSCPDAAKVGTVHITTPLLSHELEGSVYLATPAPNGEAAQNPFNSLVSLYLVAEDPVSGVLVKLAGEGQLNEGTLQIKTTFKNAPQVPFEELSLKLFGGPRASLATPSSCGSYQSQASLTPWSGTGEVNLGSPAEDFTISSGVAGTACPQGLAFSPSLSAGSGSSQGGAFTNFALELSRPDGQQALKGLSLHLPGGIAAMLSSVTLCSEAQANSNSCPPASEVGKATAIAGLGPEPYVEGGGKVFITGPYGGAPFGLEILTPAVAGPFNLGYVTVRSTIQVDPHNASITIRTPSLPTELRGIPLQLKRVLVSVDRPNFEFNPTNCDPKLIEATASGDQGGVQNLTSHFQSTGCDALPFKPTFTASTKGQTSKANGASLTVKVGSTQGQANIGKAALILPKILPSRLSTIQKACLAATFEANPASCPEGSNIGSATVHTPVLKSALQGPAYLVSHGGAAWPDVEFVLQGEGITLILDGQTQIKGGVTSSTFNAVPDAPVSSFETVLPQGPHSALTTDLPLSAKYSLCGQKLVVPTTLTGQNGARIEQQTKVAIEGCGAVKATKAKKLTRAQKLKRALASCRKRFKYSKGRRAACEAKARKLYGPKKHKRKGKGARGKAHRGEG